MQCGRGQGNPQQMRTRCEQRTETFGAVRAEDKNFLPATSLLCTVRDLSRDLGVEPRVYIKSGIAMFSSVQPTGLTGVVPSYT